ncbi:AAA family ATPase [Trueperella pecoris]|uniref:AAA family ATPase n=1 Tax=Trueperella pecoris TaxID=2733571 RepID=UPI00186B65E2|nr:SMC family ATPase [Trueperella pecoris]QOQ39283.1 SMC family ATPase [Trueperella pecoris]
MHFRRLKFSAIGPFPNSHEIDFDQLTASGLFLFEGPTGAGKSSIIDAIVFALYGDVAGRDSDLSRIRSTYADLSTESSVDLIFTIAAGTYRVRRTPQRMKKKTRGEGITSVDATANLWRLSEAAVDAGEWDKGESLATKISHVNDELKNLLGLTRDQFVQTVVLPQGQFAQFLKMKSTERAALLETLFDTSDYREFAKALEDSAKLAREKVNAAAGAATRALDAWLDIEGFAELFPDLMGLTFIDSDDATPVESIEKADAHLAQEEARAAADAQSAQEASDRARQAWEEAQGLSKALADLSKLKAQRAALEEDAQHIATCQEQIAAHERVATAISRLHHEDQCAIALRSAVSSLPPAGEAVSAEHAALVEAIASSGPIATSANALGAVAGHELTALGERVGALDGLVGLERSLPQRRGELAKLNEELCGLDSKIAATQSSLAAYPQRLAELDAELEQLRSAAAKKPVVEQKLTQHRASLAIADQLQALRTSLARAHGDLDAAARAYDAQRENLTKVTDAWRSSMAANLASELAEGLPCPVCGSHDHPYPAQPTIASASLEQVQAEEAALVPLAQAAEEQRIAVAEYETSVSNLKGQLGQQTPETIREALATLEQELANAARAEKNVAAHTKKRAELGEAQASEERSLALAREARSALSERIKNSEASINSDAQRLSEARGEFDSVKDRRASLDALRKELAAIREAAATISHRAGALAEAQAASAEELAKAGVNAEQARAVYLDHSRLVALRTEVQDFNAERARIEGQLSSERLKHLSGDEQVDLAGVKAADDAAMADLLAAHRRATLATNNARASAKALARIRKAQEGWKKTSGEAGPVVRLADLASAGSSSLTRIRLTVWVLLRRFEQIVDRANEHLREFSFGRYELQRSDEGRGEVKSGLGLEIVHHDAGPQGDHVRSPGTLSGGEIFYTSLALALALSEVVQAENGGIRIDTLIIDEGFGSLSSNYLQTIMDTLGQLRSSGRTVGVVSHVDELKAMIPDRVTVTPLSDGGSTLSVTA